MKAYFIIILMFLTSALSAQVCFTQKRNDGSIFKYARIQFGKDTVVIGQQYKAIEKLGMSITLSHTYNENYFTFILRSADEKLLTDTVDKNRAFLVFTLKNADTVYIKPLNKQHYDFGVENSKQAVMLFMHAYLTNAQLGKLAKSKLKNVRLYLNSSSFVENLTTGNEQRQFKRGMEYLVN